jgi:signal transduction histidine kinase
MTFKYRFILSFVVLEIFFILLIIFVNFSAIKNSSKNLNEEKINSNITFMKELLSVPISIYDLATLDNLIEKTQQLKYVNSIVVLDSNNKVISKTYNFKHDSLENFLRKKTNRSFTFDDETYEIRYSQLFEDDTLLGSLYFVFDTTENSTFIRENKYKTIFIVLIEILISTLLSYIIGSRLTKKLTTLSNIAKNIGKDEIVTIPYQNKNDEIATLAKSMDIMQHNLKNRNDRLKNSAKILKEQKKELIKANKTKDLFLANMSHEIRTPLNAIIGFTDILKNSNLKEKEQRQINIVSKSANSLLQIINEILDFSKIEDGKLEIISQEDSIKELLIDIINLHDAKASEKNINIHYIEDENIPDYLLFDRLRLQQILSNLLSNAIKFNKISGDIWVKTQLISKTDEEAIIYFEIKDNGIGIPKDKQELIFKPFSQADNSITKAYGGTGLGLAIINNLLQYMNTTISLESEENEGSKFYFTLKLQIAKHFNSPIQNLKSTHTSINKNSKILIAEDNSMNQQLMEAMLSELNLKADIVNNGEEAIKKSQENDYNIIFMDINMPVCDGISATKTIRKLNKNHIPIIALTANAIKGDTQKYLDSGMDEHITKPINFEKLKECLERYLAI